MQSRTRRAVLILVMTVIAFLAVAPAHAVSTFCYTVITRYEYCNICEFIGPNGEDFGFVYSCFPRSI